MKTLIRFIYAYREKATGRAVYVGSAFDVEARDKQHCKGKLSFDKMLAQRRDAFTLEIVEAFRADDIGELWRLSAARENHWMDVLGTYRAEGCFNFGRASAQYDSSAHYEAASMAKAAAWTEERRAQQVERNKKRFSPEVKRLRAVLQEVTLWIGGGELNDEHDDEDLARIEPSDCEPVWYFLAAKEKSLATRERMSREQKAECRRAQKAAKLAVEQAVERSADQLIAEARAQVYGGERCCDSEEVLETWTATTFSLLKKSLTCEPCLQH
jgi:hypothetical protein